MKLFTAITLIWAFGLLSVAHAQNWDIGVAIYGANYQGDLVKPSFFRLSETNIFPGVLVRRYLGSRYALRGNIMAGKLSGNDKNYVEDEWRPQRGFSFRTTVVEFSLQGEINLLTQNNALGERRKLVPYVCGGVAFVGSDPKVDFNEPNPIVPVLDIWRDQRDAHKTNIALPFGLGVKWATGPQSSLGVELGARPILGDYLDGVSLAGNPNKNDWYLTAGLQFLYHLSDRKDSDHDGVPDKKDKCPFISGNKMNKGCPNK